MMKVKMVNENAAEAIIKSEERFFIYGRGKLSSRDIRIFQLSMMLSGKKIHRIDEAERVTEKLGRLDERSLGIITRAFGIFNYSKERVVTTFEKGVFTILNEVRDKKSAMQMDNFLISEYTPLNKSLDIKLKDFGVKRFLPFRRHDIYTVRQLISYSPAELMKIRGIGQETLAEVTQLLERVGLRLKENE